MSDLPVPSSRAIALLPVISVGTVALAALNAVIVARLVGPSVQGVYASVIAVNAILALLMGFGTGTTLRLKRSSAAPRARQEYAAFSLTMVAFMVLIASLWSALIVESSVSIVTTALVGCHSALIYLNLQAAEYNQLDARVVRAVASFALCQSATLAALAVCVLSNSSTLDHILIATLFGMIAQLVYQFRDLPLMRSLKLRDFKPSTVRRLGREGLPVLATLGWIAGFQRANRIIIPLVASAFTAGLVAAVAVVVESIRIVPNSLGQGLFVRVSGTRRLDRGSVRLIAFSVIFTAAFAAFFLLLGDPGIRLIFGDAYAGASRFLLPLVVGEIAMAVLLIGYRLCLALGVSQVLARWSMAVGFISVASTTSIAVVTSDALMTLWALAGGSWLFALASIGLVLYSSSRNGSE